MRSALLFALFLSISLGAASTHAQQRTITVEMTPTIRTQIATWIESADLALLRRDGRLRLADGRAHRRASSRA